MAVTPYALDGMSVERAGELGANVVPNWMSAPTSWGPAVGLFSDVLGTWSPTIYGDDGTLVPSAWENDGLYAADVAEQNRLSIIATLTAALAANVEDTPTVEQLASQTSGLIRLALALLDSTAGV